MLLLFYHNLEKFLDFGVIKRSYLVVIWACGTPAFYICHKSDAKGQKTGRHITTQITKVNSFLSDIRTSHECKICTISLARVAQPCLTQIMVVNLLNDLQKKYGLSYIFISHDLSVVKALSDRVIVMSEGMVVEMGTAKQIFEEPQHEYTQLLVQASNLS